jgi:lipopolysaccharide export system permease protein
MLTYGEAADYIDSIDRSGSGSVALPQTQLWGRILYPVSVIIVTFIGFTIGYERRKGGQGVPIAIGLSVSFVYLTLIKTIEPLGYAGVLSPLMAALLPHAFFGLSAVALVLLTRK